MAKRYHYSDILTSPQFWENRDHLIMLAAVARRDDEQCRQRQAQGIARAKAEGKRILLDGYADLAAARQLAALTGTAVPSCALWDDGRIQARLDAAVERFRQRPLRA